MESPESRIVPTEDMNTVQLKISGEISRSDSGNMR